MNDLQGRILDIGGGEGELAELINTHAPDSEVIILEPQQSPWEKLSHPERFVRGEAEQLPFEREVFDTILSSFAVPNVYLGLAEEELEEKMEAAFNEMIRVVKPGGHIYLGPIYFGTEFQNERIFSRVLNDVLSSLAHLDNLEVTVTDVPLDEGDDVHRNGVRKAQIAIHKRAAAESS